MEEDLQNHIPCEFCNQLFHVNNYNQHVTSCLISQVPRSIINILNTNRVNSLSSSPNDLNNNYEDDSNDDYEDDSNDDYEDDSNNDYEDDLNNMAQNLDSNLNNNNDINNINNISNDEHNFNANNFLNSNVDDNFNQTQEEDNNFEQRNMMSEDNTRRNINNLNFDINIDSQHTVSSILPIEEDLDMINEDNSLLESNLSRSQFGRVIFSVINEIIDNAYDPIEISNRLGVVEKGIDDIEEVSELIPICNEILCPICQTETKTNVRRTLCNHFFCDQCISRWLSKSKKCPSCMQDLEDIYNNNT